MAQTGLNNDQTLMGAEPDSAGPLHTRIARTGEDLVRSLGRVVRAVGGEQSGPVALARDLRLDKVLTSRLLRALDAGDPFAAVHRMPGPEPLRRLLKACSARGADRGEVASAEGAVDRFDRLINSELGDRQALDTIVAAWVPDVRREFELRRKQAAFRAVSELRGIRAQSLYSAVLLAPSAGDEDRIDVVWLYGLYGVRRVRPDATLKLATRRLAHPTSDRRPLTLAGAPVADDPAGVRLARFCSDPPPPLEVRPLGEVVHYILGPTGYGPGSAVDLVMAERSPADLPRRVERRPERPRRAHFFAEVSTPAEMLVLDLFADERLWPGQTPELTLFDTSFEGVASVNDPARDVDRMDLLETVTPLGPGIGRAGSAEVPRARELLQEACDTAGMEGTRLRGFRVRIEYPLYGSQATLSFLAETA
ncbi:MAG: hypothetical protein IT436_09290 [Phycisphaerales bacterium]|nr:hypothetical protein [Phycisphaerales bacterium]